MKYLLIFLPFLLFGQTSNKWINNVRLYAIQTPTITVSWDAVINATFYEAREIWWDTTPEIIYDLGSTENTLIIVNRRRAGHFYYQVRSCNFDINNVKQCSEWASSLTIDSATLHDNGPGIWLVYWRLAAPSNPVIE